MSGVTMISFLKTQPVENSLAHRVSRIELCPASTEELCIGTSEKRFANQPQSAENDLCKQLVGEIDEDSA